MRVVLADDAVLFREGLARVLTDAGFEVVGQAGTAEQLLSLVDQTLPDVAVVDVRMPPTHTTEGFDAALQIRRDAPGVGVLILSQNVETEHVVVLMQDDASGVGYLLKDRVCRLDVFCDSVRAIGARRSVVDPEIVSDLVGRRKSRDVLSELTDREREVLALMASGRSNLAIGRKLFLSAKTVEAHVHSIFTKMGLEPAPDDHRRVLAVLNYVRSGRPPTAQSRPHAHAVAR